jgi:hypothetical protein
MSNFDIEAGPGLGSEDKRGRYFSLLPIELLYIIQDYYYYPVKITITDFNENTSMETLIERIKGEQDIDSINTKLNLNEMLNSLRRGGRHYVGKLGISLEGPEVDFVYSGSDVHIKIQYNEYETKVLFDKLKLIQHEIRSYRNAGLSASDIEAKLTRYVY